MVAARRLPAAPIQRAPCHQMTVSRMKLQHSIQPHSSVINHGLSVASGHCWGSHPTPSHGRHSGEGTHWVPTQAVSRRRRTAYSPGAPTARTSSSHPQTQRPPSSGHLPATRGGRRTATAVLNAGACNPSRHASHAQPSCAPTHPRIWRGLGRRQNAN